MKNNKLQPKKRKKKLNELDVDETSDHPIHEPYTQLEPYKE